MTRTHQLNVLAALDRALTQRHHLAAAAFAGTGLLTGSYNLFSIVFVSKLVGCVYYADAASGSLGERPSPGKLPPDVVAALNGVVYCGTFVSHLAFGWLGDRIGRRRTYGLALALMAACSAASGLSFGRTAKAVVGTLCFFRFWLGGAYPLSAAIVAENANKRTRGAFVAAVHAMQGVGILLGCTVDLVLSSFLPEADYMWRAILMVGALPAALSFYPRTKLPETSRYTALVDRDPKLAAADMSRVQRASIQEQQELSVSVGGVDDECGLLSF